MEGMMEASSEDGVPAAISAISALPASASRIIISPENLSKRSARNSRVHFDEEGEGYLPQLQEERPILVRFIREECSKRVEVYLGFVQEEHKYRVKFTLPLDQCEGYLCPEGGPVGRSLTTATVDLQPADDVSVSKGSSNSNGSIPAIPADFSCQPPVDASRGNDVTVHKKGNYCEVSSLSWTWKPSASPASEGGGAGGVPTELSSSSSSCRGLEVLMEVKIPSAASVRLLEDELSLRTGEEEIHQQHRFIHVNVTAKVMGKNMGTPTLKDGVNLIGKCEDSLEHSPAESSADEK